MAKILSVGFAVAAALAAPAVQAAGAGTGIESGFTDVGTDLNTLLTGAGGFIVLIISIIFGAVMLAVGQGWKGAIGAFAVAIVLGYGVTALTGIAGVTATTDLLAAEATVETEPAV